MGKKQEIQQIPAFCRLKLRNMLLLLLNQNDFRKITCHQLYQVLSIKLTW